MSDGNRDRVPTRITGMSTDTDLRQALDRCFGDGPPLTPVADQVALGRRRLRRRRVTAALLAGAATLVVVGGAWGATRPGADDAERGVRVAQGPESAEVDPWTEDQLVRFGDGGRIEVNPAAEILTSSEVETRGRVGKAYRVRDAEDAIHYVLAVPATQEITSAPEGSQGLKLGEWAMAQLDPDYLPPTTSWVAFDDDGELVARPGVTLVRQLLDPPFETFAGAQDLTAAAEVRRGGRTYFLAVRSVDGGPTEAIAYRQESRVRTFEEFVDFARQQYAVNDQGGSEGLL